MKSQKLLSLGVAAVAVASIAAGSLIFSNGSDNSASALGLSDSQVTQIALNVAATPAEERDAYLQKIADNLGVDLAKLKEAIGKANVDTLSEKVADGSITQERADAMREKLATGDMFFFGGKGGPGGKGEHGGPGGRGEFGIGGPGIGANNEDLATFFGIDAATLKTELQTKSLATIATDHGKSVDALKTFLSDQVKTQLSERVAAGQVTQAQADEKLAAFQQNLDEEINEVHTHPAEGERGSRMAPGAAPSSSTTTQ